MCSPSQSSLAELTGNPPFFLAGTKVQRDAERARGSSYVDTAIYRTGNGGGMWPYRRSLLLSSLRLAPNAFSRVVSKLKLAADDHMRHAVRWVGSVVEGNYAFTLIRQYPA